MNVREPGSTTGELPRADVAGASMDIVVYGCDVDEAALFRSESAKFGITPIITAEPITEATIPLAAGIQCISVGHKWTITNAHLVALSKVGVRYISTRSIGFNHVDVDFAASVGITVGNVSYSPDSVADYTLMLMLMAIRHAKSVLRRADIHDYRLHDVRGRELRDLTIGVVGTGRIGAAVIDRLIGFGCHVIAYDRQQRAGVEYVSLDDLMLRSDIVTLHTPLDTATYHLIDAPRIAEMRPGAYLINTGRGGLIDTDALVVALETGHLGGVAVDVVEGEDGIFYAEHDDRSYDTDALARLQGLPNAIVTPHSAYFTDHALSDTVVNSLINCSQFTKEKTHG